MEVAARDLKHGVLVRLGDKLHRVERTDICDGKTERLQFFSCRDLKTAAALRIHFDGGRSILVHPSMTLDVET